MTEPRDVRILIVDDDPAIRELVGTALKEEGYSTSTASNMADAVDTLKQGGFNLGILDIYLPDGTGLELAAKIKEITPNLPVIIMTGTPDSENIGRSVDIEVDAYLIKPITIVNLVSLVRELT